MSLVIFQYGCHYKVTVSIPIKCQKSPPASLYAITVELQLLKFNFSCFSATSTTTKQQKQEEATCVHQASKYQK